MLAAEQHGEEATARRRGGLQQRATPSSNTSTLRFTAPMRFTWFYNSDASELSRTKRHVAHRASPRHCHACARCSAPCTRAHACRARSSRTHHACAPRQPCTCSHVATHACTRQKAGCRARVTGHWLTVGRLATGASRIRMLSNLTRHPPLQRAAFIKTHIVHAIHHLRLPCRVQRESIMSNETTVNETMLNETMLKTADMMSDTNECVPCRTHKHAAKCQYPPEDHGCLHGRAERTRCRRPRTRCRSTRCRRPRPR